MYILLYVISLNIYIIFIAETAVFYLSHIQKINRDICKKVILKKNISENILEKIFRYILWISRYSSLVFVLQTLNMHPKILEY